MISRVDFKSILVSRLIFYEKQKGYFKWNIESYNNRTNKYWK